MKRGSVEKLRPCPRDGASWRAGVGWVRKLAFLSILRGGLLLSEICRPVKSGVPTELFRSLLISLDAPPVHLKALSMHWFQSMRLDDV